MTNDSLRETIEAEERNEERLLLGELDALYQAKRGKADWQHEEDRYDPDKSQYGKMGRVRRWLTDHEGETLEDPETGVYAQLRKGGRVETWDAVMAIRERAPNVFQRLLELGCLRVDGQAVANAVKARLLVPGDFAGFVKDTEGTPRLYVDRKK